MKCIELVKRIYYESTVGRTRNIKCRKKFQRMYDFVTTTL